VTRLAFLCSTFFEGFRTFSFPPKKFHSRFLASILPQLEGVCTAPLCRCYLNLPVCFRESHAHGLDWLSVDSYRQGRMMRGVGMKDLASSFN